MKDNQIEDEKIEEISVEEDKYGGVILTVQKPMDSVYFATQLEDFISYWKQQGKKGMWINLPILHSNLVESAVKAGFMYHHAESDYLMLVYRIPDTSVSIPSNASHRVGIGAYVVNNKKEVLVVQDISGKFGGTGVWKMPTGVVDEGNREIGFLLDSYPKAYVCYIRDSLLNIPPRYHMALLGLCGSYLISEMKTITAPFENFQLKKTTNAPPQPLLLTFGEAFETFFPQITHITTFLLCTILTAVLIFRLHPGVQIILCMFLLIPAFFFYLLELAHNASKTGVSCGTIKLPLFWFTTLGAVGISFMFMLATLLLVNISWRLSTGKARVEDLDDASLDVISEAL